MMDYRVGRASTVVLEELLFDYLVQSWKTGLFDEQAAIAYDRLRLYNREDGAI